MVHDHIYSDPLCSRDWWGVTIRHVWQNCSVYTYWSSSRVTWICTFM